MNTRFAMAVAIVSGLVVGAVGVLKVAANDDSVGLLVFGAGLAVVAVLGLLALGRALVLEERDGSHGGW